MTPSARRPLPGPHRVRRHGALALAAAALVLTGCSDDDPAEEPDTLEESTGTQRLRTDGLTLVWPTDVFADAVVGDPAGDAAVAVDFPAADPESRSGRLTVVVARTATGELSDDLSADERAMLDVLDAESGDDAEGSADTVDFVNGRGVRSVEDSYRFDGLTTDGRFLVAFEVPSPGPVDRLDAMIGTVFVDGAAAVYGGPECDDAVELVNENGLAEGATAAPGSEVVATWEIRNTGTCTWNDSYSWVFTGGQPVTIVSTSALATTPPGETTEVQAVFVAPDEPGQYAAQWQLQPPTDFEPLGTPAFALFVVEQ